MDRLGKGVGVGEIGGGKGAAVLPRGCPFSTYPLVEAVTLLGLLPLKPKEMRPLDGMVEFQLALRIT
jgi:hypothetical protein